MIHNMNSGVLCGSVSLLLRVVAPVHQIQLPVLKLLDLTYLQCHHDKVFKPAAPVLYSVTTLDKSANYAAARLENLQRFRNTILSGDGGQSLVIAAASLEAFAQEQ